VAAIDIACPECAMVLMIEEDQLSSELKCPRCKHRFKAEESESGATFDIADEPPPRPSASEPSRQAAGDPTPPAPETEAERQIRERLEKWAEQTG
jgi:predicted Zn finger-like uncharacterized protein